MTVDTRLGVGCRIESEGHHGTVRYVGEVPPTKGEWLGVEWDELCRGKHDGSHNGKRYFQTKRGNSGSFLRHKKANRGVTFLEALHDRYGKSEDDDAGVIQKEMFVVGKNQQTTHVEIVGAKSVNRKQSQFSMLRELAFRNMSVNGEPSGADIGQLLPNVKLLDLSGNLIPSWEGLATITRTLKRLETLNIGSNRFDLPSNPERLVDAFQGVKVLFLNRMDYNWEEVLQCCEMFPSLEELHVCINNITSVTRLHRNLHNLKVLNVEANAIRDWHSILVFGQLHNLELLIINECQLETIEFPDAQYFEKTQHFPKLHTLHCKQNDIKEFKYIDELNKLHSLSNLILMKNPVNEPTLCMSEETIWYIMVAKIASLQVLNRSQIAWQERKGAEVDYLKKYGKVWKEAGGHQDPHQNKPSVEFCKQHPRYQAIVDKYGPAEDSEFKEFSSALKNSLISIIFKCPDVANKKEVTKKLPITMTVGKLKQLAQRLYRADLGSMQLFYTTPKMAEQEIELDHDMKEIGFYSIEQGDTVLVRWDTS